MYRHITALAVKKRGLISPGGVTLMKYNLLHVVNVRPMRSKTMNDYEIWLS